MWLKTLGMGALGLIVLAAGWRAKDSVFVRDLLSPPDARAPNIRFDNGSVRDAMAPASGAAPAAGAAIAPGGLRKCQRGGQVTYTDKPCPPGHREQAVAPGNFSVVGSPPAPPRLPKNARDALRPPEEESLRDKHMDRVIGR